MTGSFLDSFSVASTDVRLHKQQSGSVEWESLLLSHRTLLNVFINLLLVSSQRKPFYIFHCLAQNPYDVQSALKIVFYCPTTLFSSNSLTLLFCSQSLISCRWKICRLLESVLTPKLNFLYFSVWHKSLSAIHLSFCGKQPARGIHRSKTHPEETLIYTVAFSTFWKWILLY